MKEEPSSFCENNSQLINKWRNDSIKHGEKVPNSNDKVDFIANILDRAAKELKRLILGDSHLCKNKTSLANYDLKMTGSRHVQL